MLSILTVINFVPFIAIASVSRWAFSVERIAKLKYAIFAVLCVSVAVYFVFAMLHGLFREIGLRPSLSILYAAAAAGLTLIAACIESREVIRYSSAIKSWRKQWSEWVSGDLEVGAISAVQGVALGTWPRMATLVGSLQLLFVLTFMENPRISPVAENAAAPGRGFTIWGVAVGAMLIIIALERVQEVSNPSRYMVQQGIWYLLPAPRAPRARMFPKARKIAVSRWRSPVHRRGVCMASSLIRSLAGLRKKLDAEDFAWLESVYRRVALLLRRRAVHIGGNEHDYEYAELCMAAVALAVNENPLEACRKAEALVGRQEPCEVAHRSRMMQVLEYIDGLLQRYTRILLVFLGVFVVFVLLATGQYTKTLELLQQLVSSPTP